MIVFHRLLGKRRPLTAVESFLDELEYNSNAEARREDFEVFRTALEAGEIDKTDYEDCDNALAAGVIPHRLSHARANISKGDRWWRC